MLSRSCIACGWNYFIDPLGSDVSQLQPHCRGCCEPHLQTLPLPHLPLRLTVDDRRRNLAQHLPHPMRSLLPAMLRIGYYQIHTSFDCYHLWITSYRVASEMMHISPS